MKKINLNEEFHAPDGYVWQFITNDAGKVIMKPIRKSGKVKEFVAPTLQEVKDFFKLKGYTEQTAINFHAYYDLGNWKDSNDKPVKNWRQKAQSVWFRKEHLIPKETTSDSGGTFLF